MIVFHAIFVLLLAGTSVFFTALAVLNVQYAEVTVAEETEWLRDHLDIEDPSELLEYNRLTTAMGHLQTWVTLIIVFLVLYSGAFADVVSALEMTNWPLVARGSVFFVGATIVFDILGLPFDVVNTFVVEEMFEFNQQTLRQFVRDKIITLAVTGVIVGIISAGLFGAIEMLGGVWWIAAWALFVAFALLMQVVYPRVIAPLFNDFEPIESGDLYEAVQTVFDRAGFSVSEIYEMDASRRSSHVNAYFVGFGRTKRVVLFDTLVEQLSVPAVQSVLAHELAHYDRKHIWKQLAVSALWTGGLLFVASVLLDLPWVYDMFAVAGQPAYAGLALATLWLSPIGQLSGPLTNRLSLAHEREADAYAVEIMSADAMADALESLARENLANPFPHPLYEAFHYDHPPIPERLRHIREIESETEETVSPDRSQSHQ